MPRFLVVAALSLSSLASAAPWDIDSGHASANFSVRHMMVSEVHGTLGEVKGTIDLDEKDLTKSKIDATVDVAALSTRNQKRDDHLRSEAFFNAEKFPSLSFKSTKVEKLSDDKLRITGDLSIRGTTKSVVLETTLTPEVQNPFSKAATRGAVATTTINREDFGLVWNMAIANNGVLVGNDVKIQLELEFVKRGPKPAAPAK
ncbi:MAG: YceI family protein [Deltaproteobacteria bacterium]|nr:YceI family protein [Deltaproteobacteria bacterium]